MSNNKSFPVHLIIWLTLIFKLENIMDFEFII